MLPESLQTLVLLTSGGFVSGSWFWISTLMPANTASSYIARDTEKFGIGQYETFTHSQSGVVSTVLRPIFSCALNHSQSGVVSTVFPYQFGFPSQYTLQKVCSLVDTQAFMQLFVDWINDVVASISAKQMGPFPEKNSHVIALDSCSSTPSGNK